MSIYERMFDSNVRIEAAWPFPVSPAPDAIAELLEDGEEVLPPEIAKLIKGWSEDERDTLFGGQSLQFSDAFDELCGNAFRDLTFGWIGVVAVPVFTPHSRGGCSFSWGHYRTRVLFCTSADELLVAACEWAEDQYRQDSRATPDRDGIGK